MPAWRPRNNFRVAARATGQPKCQFPACGARRKGQDGCVHERMTMKTLFASMTDTRPSPDQAARGGATDGRATLRRSLTAGGEWLGRSLALPGKGAGRTRGAGGVAGAKSAGGWWETAQAGNAHEGPAMKTQCGGSGRKWSGRDGDNFVGPSPGGFPVNMRPRVPLFVLVCATLLSSHPTRAQFLRQGPNLQNLSLRADILAAIRERRA